MEFSKVFKKKLEDKINSIMKDDEDIFDADTLDYFYKLLYIYNIIFSVDTQREQLKLASDSMNMLKNIDFSKLDINDIMKRIGK